MIARVGHLQSLARLLRRYRIVALLGARQVGKTTLAKALASRWRGQVTYFDLERPSDVARLADPELALSGLTGLVVLDEVHRRPDLFPILRVLADRKRGARFLVLGSASPQLLRQGAESLAGRIAFHELGPLNLSEVRARQWKKLWLRGGFPAPFLSRSDAESGEWHRNFVATFLERDIPQFGVTISGETLRRFWTMLAHVHAQILNWSELGQSLGVADTTVRRYLEILASTFMVTLLRPWHSHLGKREVKSPKVYVVDSGLLHSLLNLPSQNDLEAHPKVGASWEGFCLRQVLQRLGARADEAYFWSTHAGAELDLLVVRGRFRFGFEFKRTAAPAMTRSMHVALKDLNLNGLDVIYPGNETFPLSDKTRAVGITRLASDLHPL